MTEEVVRLCPRDPKHGPLKQDGDEAFCFRCSYREPLNGEVPIEKHTYERPEEPEVEEVEVAEVKTGEGLGTRYPLSIKLQAVTEFVQGVDRKVIVERVGCSWNSLDYWVNQYGEAVKHKLDAEAAAKADAGKALALGYGGTKKDAAEEKAPDSLAVADAEAKASAEAAGAWAANKAAARAAIEAKAAADPKTAKDAKAVRKAAKKAARDAKAARKAYADSAAEEKIYADAKAGRKAAADAEAAEKADWDAKAAAAKAAEKKAEKKAEELAAFETMLPPPKPLKLADQRRRSDGSLDFTEEERKLILLCCRVNGRKVTSDETGINVSTLNRWSRWLKLTGATQKSLSNEELPLEDTDRIYILREKLNKLYGKRYEIDRDIDAFKQAIEVLETSHAKSSTTE